MALKCKTCIYRKKDMKKFLFLLQEKTYKSWRAKKVL